MYQLSMTVTETIGAYICRATVSSVDQWGKTKTVAVSAPTFIEVDPAFLEDDLLQILRSAERFVRKLADSPNN